MMHSKINALIAALALLLGLSGCVTREFCYPIADGGADLRVVIDWRYVPEIDALITKAETEEGIPEVKVPRVMTVIFFPEDGSQPIRYDLTDITGSTVRLKQGRYKVLTFNSTSDRLQHGGSLFEDYRSYVATKGNPFDVFKDSGMDPELLGLKYLTGMDRLYSDGIADPFMVEVLPAGETQVITLYPKARNKEVRYVIHNVRNASHVAQIHVSVSGVTDRFYTGTNEKGEEEYAIQVTADYTPYDIAMDPGTGDIEGEGMILGDSDVIREGDRYYLNIVVVMTDGSVFAYRYDVTEDFLRDREKVEIVINIDELIFDTPLVNGKSGFPITVDAFEEVIIPLPV